MTQRLVTRKLITIICEAALEDDLTAVINSTGATGYTISDARGKGAHGLRDALWPESANIRIEVLCDDDLASMLLDQLLDKYYKNYTLITFVSDVGVLRPAKFEKHK
jgi:nitrogen regulatory protein PII